ncbi:methyltransferase domain-containing protein [Pseudodesulfovibrio cashew]|uniref:Methyltransferase domain-containing protein n=1 Tax=Pseudodesulfovibrio cashew TaxID=2678688 RepID=A0A6I6JBB2_9BACT|nr:class I SAM-dependent methyltransferase [Pseudodesulfovibrio cashew]QGY39361.1 methyltransferase domain-containing protein [Pseudodesulfovibrio cashew]
MAAGKCIVCHERREKPLFNDMRDFEYGIESDQTGFVRCDSCGLIRLDPLPEAEALPTLYPAEYANIHAEENRLSNFLLETYFGLVHRYFKKRLPGKARILDVGCAAGHFIGYLQDREPEWSVEGIDLNRHACEMAASLGRTVHHGAFEDAALPEQQYDLIILSHLIEHVVNPAALLEKAGKLLADGGRLYIETPNVNCLDFRIFGKYWGGLHFPRHTFLFSPETVGTLLERQGFSLEEQGATLNMFGWALSLQNYLADRFDLRVVNGRIAAYPFMMLGLLPLTLIQKVFGNAAGMRILARKEKLA